MDFNRKNSGNIVYYTAPTLDASGLCVHAFSTRFGGVSQGIFETMNLSFSRGDDPDAVRENHERMTKLLGVSFDRIVSGKQVHNCRIRVVRENDFGIADGYDGMVTNVSGKVLLTHHADCAPVFLLDPVKKAIGLAHSGWRGTAKGIAARTVESMQDEYVSDPDDLIAAIGPRIGQCCFETRDDVPTEMCASLGEWTDKYCLPFGEKFKVDIGGIIAETLMRAGVKRENICISTACTCCGADFFSHRRQGASRGSMAAFFALK